MSYRAMLKHRGVVYRLQEINQGGYVSHSWMPVQIPLLDENGDPVLDGSGQPETQDLTVRCFLDLNFIRKGKDPMWTAEAGRPADRSGVLFLTGTDDVRSADRIKMTKGPSGTFQIEGAIDEAWRPTDKHHTEVGVQEVAQALARDADSGTYDPNQ